jgi:hypothetical protein
LVGWYWYIRVGMKRLCVFGGWMDRPPPPTATCLLAPLPGLALVAVDGGSRSFFCGIDCRCCCRLPLCCVSCVFACVPLGDEMWVAVAVRREERRCCLLNYSSSLVSSLHFHSFIPFIASFLSLHLFMYICMYKPPRMFLSLCICIPLMNENETKLKLTNKCDQRSN